MQSLHMMAKIGTQPINQINSQGEPTHGGGDMIDIEAPRYPFSALPSLIDSVHRYSITFGKRDMLQIPSYKANPPPLKGKAIDRWCRVLYCRFHPDYGHKMEDCYNLWKWNCMRRQLRAPQAISCQRFGTWKGEHGKKRKRRQPNTRD